MFGEADVKPAGQFGQVSDGLEAVGSGTFWGWERPQPLQVGFAPFALGQAEDGVDGLVQFGASDECAESLDGGAVEARGLPLRVLGAEEPGDALAHVAGAIEPGRMVVHG